MVMTVIIIIIIIIAIYLLNNIITGPNVAGVIAIFGAF
jgi:hypothetical protein